MADDRSAEARSRAMAAVRSKDTAPEIAVRRLLHRMGYRFRLHLQTLPGKPDIILPKYKVCIFVHGCFWHRHADCKRATVPSSNKEFWRLKFEKNIIRDEFVKAELERLGWHVCVIWTCFVKDEIQLSELLQKCLIGDKNSGRPV
jgi:DNA mismatch endonuclease (patch repair protein)